jgi:uncharacterized protein
MKHANVLMKVSERCPLECLYCYEGDKSPRVMDQKTLENSVRILETRNDVKSTSYIWHGSEPLTAGIEFYKKVRELQKPYEKHHVIKNGMQSNGVLLTPKLADFFIEENIGFGLSLDGPEHIHEKTRPYTNGRKTSFKDTMYAIELMSERGKRPGVIAVLTKLSLPYLDEMYDFFKENKLNFKINPLIECGFAIGNQELALTNKEVTTSLTYLFDKWFLDQNNAARIEYGNMMSIAQAIFTKGGTPCNMMENCQDSFLGIGAEGTIYPCSRYSSPEFSYGNINEIPLFEDILNHPLRQKLSQRYKQNKDCTSCDYDDICYSGCMHNAHNAGDVMGKDPICGVNKVLYEHISGRILEGLEKKSIPIKNLKQDFEKIKTKERRLKIIG